MHSNVNIKKVDTISKDINKRKVTELKNEMKLAEKIIWNEKIPVIIFVEGESEDLKSDIIKHIISRLETITYNLVFPYKKNDNDIHFMIKYWRDISEKGKVKLFYNSPYNEIIFSKLENKLSHHQLEKHIKQINIFERQLSNDGYVIIKLFVHSKKDSLQNNHFLSSNKYNEYIKYADKILQKTSTSDCPWFVLDGENKDTCLINTYKVIINAIKCKNHPEDNKILSNASAKPYSYKFNIVNTKKLCEINQESILIKQEYKYELKKQQKIFADNVAKLKRKNISLVLAFEGWDASGKGGNIKRIIKPLQPLDYKVVPVPAPTKEELSKHYLWRFYNKFSDKGRVTIFDRTWYGRVLVERVEKITAEKRCVEAFREINEFEKQLSENKTIIVKFWLHIDKDEQLNRFKSRQEDEKRRWKICDDDWRNRDKWEQYEKCVNEMIEKTSTDFAPWNIIGANDKKYSRVKSLKIINQAIKNYLADKQ